MRNFADIRFSFIHSDDHNISAIISPEEMLENKLTGQGSIEMTIFLRNFDRAMFDHFQRKEVDTADRLRLEEITSAGYLVGTEDPV